MDLAGNVEETIAEYRALVSPKDIHATSMAALQEAQESGAHLLSKLRQTQATYDKAIEHLKAQLEAENKAQVKLQNLIQNHTKQSLLELDALSQRNQEKGISAAQLEKTKLHTHQQRMEIQSLEGTTPENLPHEFKLDLLRLAIYETLGRTPDWDNLGVVMGSAC